MLIAIIALSVALLASIIINVILIRKIKALKESARLERLFKSWFIMGE